MKTMYEIWEAKYKKYDVKCEKCCGDGVVDVDWEKFYEILSDEYIKGAKFKELLAMYRKWKKQNKQWTCDACGGKGYFTVEGV